MKSTNDNAQHLLNELGRALAEAIASSDEVGHAVRRIRDRGFALNLTLDCEQDGNAKARVSLPTRNRSQHDAAPPAYRLDGNDVALLKSLGIDATRPPRRR